MVDRHLIAVKAKHGLSLAKAIRSVLSGVCALACRYDALVTNPCSDAPESRQAKAAARRARRGRAQTPSPMA
jgi:hypothetical protein